MKTTLWSQWLHHKAACILNGSDGTSQILKSNAEYFFHRWHLQPLPIRPTDTKTHYGRLGDPGSVKPRAHLRCEGTLGRSREIDQPSPCHGVLVNQNWLGLINNNKHRHCTNPRRCGLILRSLLWWGEVDPCDFDLCTPKSIVFLGWPYEVLGMTIPNIHTKFSNHGAHET